MGEPVRVYELAKSMIELSGLTVRSAANPNGDIEIVEVGLRPGEKLYEELLIEENALPTSHRRIVKAHESMIDWLHLRDASMNCAMRSRARTSTKRWACYACSFPVTDPPRARPCPR